MAREAYARGANGEVYYTRADYERARFQSMGTQAAVRARINRKIGGRIV